MKKVSIRRAAPKRLAAFWNQRFKQGAPSGGVIAFRGGCDLRDLSFYRNDFLVPDSSYGLGWTTLAFKSRRMTLREAAAILFPNCTLKA